MKQVLLPVDAEPTVAFSIAFGVGSQNDPPGKEGLACLTGLMLTEAATKSRSYDEILAALYPLAADYSATIDRELTTVTGRVHVDKLGAFTDLLLEALLEPAFATDDFERIRSDSLNFLTKTLRYSSDEDLGKAMLYASVYAGTPYAHPDEGTVAGLESISLDDVRSFYETHYTRDNVTLGLGGGFDEALVDRLAAALEALPAGALSPPPPIRPAEIRRRQVTLIDKPGADASISFGFPLDVHRGEHDFYALWLANSWLGEHRNGASHLFQVIREQRGLNYGDYSYIESFPNGGMLQMPPVNVPRRRQLFEVWIRTVPNEQAVFALRAALRELTALVENGLTSEQFELTRAFLGKYCVHFAPTVADRLGYAIDDRWYGLEDEGHLERFRRMMGELTLDEVNSAVTHYLQTDRMRIAIVTGDAEGLRAALTSGQSSPIEYANPMPESVLAEDREIAGFPLDIGADDVEIVAVDSVFAS